MLHLRGSQGIDVRGTMAIGMAMLAVATAGTADTAIGTTVPSTLAPDV